jgi:hypothetical protein
LNNNTKIITMGITTKTTGIRITTGMLITMTKGIIAI